MLDYDNNSEILYPGMIEGIAIVIAGAFLLTPGFLTDTLGAILLIPPLRLKIVEFVIEYLKKSFTLKSNFTRDTENENKDKIIKFSGCYHGHADSFLIQAGSGALTFGEPNSPGITKGTAQDTLIAQFNDIQTVEDHFVTHGSEISCVILEPINGNAGCILPKDGFLQDLRVRGALAATVSA